MEKEFKIKRVKFLSNKMFSKYLNYSAAFIIFIIILFFISQFATEQKKVDEKIQTHIKFVPSGVDKINSTELNKLIDDKFKEIKIIQKEAEKERNESMKYHSTLIGFILSIVGFFGFKSIHDTRQAAIESVKIKAEEVAKKVTSEKIEEYVNKNIETSINNYLEEDGNELIKRHSEKTAKIIAFDESRKVSKDITEQEFNKLKNSNEEARRAMRLDIESIERDKIILLRRIQDLEQKIYGLPKSEDDNDEPRNDNEVTLV